MPNLYSQHSPLHLSLLPTLANQPNKSPQLPYPTNLFKQSHPSLTLNHSTPNPELPSDPTSLALVQHMHNLINTLPILMQNLLLYELNKMKSSWKWSTPSITSPKSYSFCLHQPPYHHLHLLLGYDVLSIPFFILIK